MVFDQPLGECFSPAEQFLPATGIRPGVDECQDQFGSRVRCGRGHAASVLRPMVTVPVLDLTLPCLNVHTL